MQSQSSTQKIKLQIAWPIVGLGAALGAVLAWGALSGDVQGRVNLLYLLLVYLFLPVGSLVISTVSLVKGRGLNFARLIVAMPIWSNQKRLLLNKTRQLHVEKYWLFFQSHLAALAFSLTSLLAFFLLLLATDINFVWRSTLLSATDLQPLLKAVAAPWYFWSGAQPTVELLQATQDSRLQTLRLPADQHGYWWKFVLAVQLFYCVILRTGLLVITAWLFRGKIKNDFEQELAAQVQAWPNQDNAPDQYQPVAQTLPDDITINNWAGVDLKLLADFQGLDLTADNLLNSGPLATQDEQQLAEHWRGQQVVLVKAWEPPMGELADFLQAGLGFIWPLDWKDGSLVSLRQQHLQEWQRFAEQLPAWQVYLPAELVPENPS